MNYKLVLPRKTQRPSKQTDEGLAKKIIRLANNYKHKYKDKFYYKIASELSIRIERVKTCLKNATAGGKIIFNKKQPWKTYSKYFYDIKTWKQSKEKNKLARNQKHISKSLEKAKIVIEFIKDEYNKPIILELANGQKTKKYFQRSVNEYLREYQKQKGTPPIKKSTIYRHIKNKRKHYKRLYFPRLYKCFQVKRAKANFKKLPFQKIDQQPPIPKGEANHFQADSVIGKATDKKALATTLDVNTGKVTINLYDRKASSFARVIDSRIGKGMRSLRIDNGAENSNLHIYLPKDKIFTCYSYRSWEKAAIENMHRLIRMVWPKGKSMDLLTDNAVAKIETIVNNYYRPRYNKYSF